MKFSDSIVPGEFLIKLYDALYSSRLLIRSYLYGESCDINISDLDIVLFLLICEMEEFIPLSAVDD